MIEAFGPAVRHVGRHHGALSFCQGKIPSDVASTSKTLSTLASFYIGCLLCYLYAAGALAANIMLRGQIQPFPTVNGVVYSTQLIELFIHDILSSRDQMIAELSTFHNNVIYLDTHQDASYSLSTTSVCGLEGKLNDIYGATVLSSFINEILAGMSNGHSLQPNEMVVLDCTFDGILEQDVSSAKAFIVDRNLTYLSTVVVQVMMMVRPQMRMSVACTVAWIVNATFDSIRDMSMATDINVDDIEAVVAIEYPFEMAPFQSMQAQENENGVYSAVISSTKENVIICGTDGEYVESPAVFSTYDNYIIKIPTTIQDFILNIHFTGRPLTKNAWAWGQLVANLCMAALIFWKLFLGGLIGYGTHCRVPSGFLQQFPDIGHSLVTMIELHAFSTICTCILDSGWTIYSWCQVSAIKRNQAHNTYYMPEAMECICLSWAVLFANRLAKLLRTYVHLSFVVAPFFLCYTLSSWINASIGVARTSADEYINTFRLESLVPTSHASLEQWMYHPIHQYNKWIIINEMSWFLWTLALIVLVIALHTVLQHRQSKVSPFFERPFYFEEGKVDLNQGGTYLAVNPRLIAHNKTYATQGQIWALGLVIVNDIYLVAVQDIPKMIFNAVTHTPVFPVYCYSVLGTFVGPTLGLCRYDVCTLREIFQLSLIPLEQEAISPSTGALRTATEQRKKRIGKAATKHFLFFVIKKFKRVKS